ncbi:hypothetical protein [Kalamiella sp. sgz302252]|uniref:hypothetical protein n=1 Tax=Pantoea sp. sgz302252 TaxID=3341827 RepID=UPI0036D43BC0
MHCLYSTKTLCCIAPIGPQSLPTVMTMTDPTQNRPTSEPRHRLDDAHFAIVVLAVASFTLIIFVLMVTLLIT